MPDVRGPILPGSLAFHLGAYAGLAGAYTQVSLIFHQAGFDIWHRPEGTSHPVRFSFGRRAVNPVNPEETPRAAAWINVKEHRFVINGGLPEETGLIALRGQFPPEQFPRQPDSQNIKIALEPGLALEVLDALSQRLTQALAAMPPDSLFAPRPEKSCFLPEDYVPKS